MAGVSTVTCVTSHLSAVRMVVGRVWCVLCLGRVNGVRTPMLRHLLCRVRIRSMMMVH